MLKRLGALVGFVFFWMVSALILPIVFWVIGGIILTITIIHVVRAGEFHSAGKFFTGVGVFTVLLATGGFFLGGSDVEAEPTELGLTAEADADDVDSDDADDTDADADAGETGKELADDGADAQPTPSVDVKAAIKAATGVAKKKKDCKSLEAIAEAWKQLSLVPADDKDYGKAKKAAKGLEGCRKKAANPLLKGATKTRAKERVALAKGLKKELAADGIKIKPPKPQGKTKDKLTIKWPKVKEEQIDELTASGSTDEGTLLGRLQAAGFVKVTISGGKVSKSFDLEPAADDAAAKEQLETLGLTEPLLLE